MRKTAEVHIEDEGRDQGKIFVIQEMSATKAEKWAMRALSVLARSGADIGAIGGGGMQQMAFAGMDALTKLDYDLAEPLLDELMTCVTYRPDPNRPYTRDWLEEDIEEVPTLLKLKWEAFLLHASFFMKGSKPAPTPAPQPTPPESSNTPISPPSSVRFSRSAAPKRRRSET